MERGTSTREGQQQVLVILAKSCVFDLLAGLVNEVKRRMETEGGEMDDLVAAMGKLWLDGSSQADHKRVFARMTFAAIEIKEKRTCNMSAKKKIQNGVTRNIINTPTTNP